MKYTCISHKLTAQLMIVLESKDLLELIFGFLVPGDTLTGSTYKSLCLVNKLFLVCIKRVFPDADVMLADHLHEIMRQYNIKEYEQYNHRMSWDDLSRSEFIGKTNACYWLAERTDLPDDQIIRLYKKHGIIPKNKKTFEEHMDLGEDHALFTTEKEKYNYINCLMISHGIFPPKDYYIDPNMVSLASLICDVHLYLTFDELKSLGEDYFRKEGWSSFSEYACVLPYTPYEFIKDNPDVKTSDAQSWVEYSNSDVELCLYVAKEYRFPRWKYLGNPNVLRYPELLLELEDELFEYIDSNGFDDDVIDIITFGRLPTYTAIKLFFRNFEQGVVHKIRYYEIAIYINRIPLRTMLEIARISGDPDIINMSLEFCNYTYKDVTPEMMNNPIHRASILKNSFGYGEK